MKKIYKHFILGMLIIGSTSSVHAFPKLSVNANAADVSRVDLEKLLSETEVLVKRQQSLYGYKYDGSKEDYLKHIGLINSAQGNCNNSNNYYKPEWMFNGDVNNRTENYYTERQNRIPENMKGQRHWVEMAFPEAQNDIVIKFTCIINDGNIAYGEAPTKIALVAPNEGEVDKWTDTLFLGKTIPTYPTKYEDNDIRQNTTYVGRFKLSHPVKKLRFVGMERLNDPKTTLEANGPFWGLAEMRIYDGKEWDSETDLSKLLPKAVKENINISISEAKEALLQNSANLTAVYNQLKTASDAYIKSCDDILRPKVSTVLDNILKTLNGTQYLKNSNSMFYSYVDKSKLSSLESYIAKADNELSRGGLTLETYNYLKEANASLDEQINPTAALAYWNAYDWDSYGTVKINNGIKECLDKLSKMDSHVFKDWAATVDKFNGNVEIGYPVPKDGHFFRITGAVNSVSYGYYLTSINASSTNNGQPRPLLSFKNFGQEEPDASTIFYQDNGNQLYGYINGHVLRHAPGSHLFASVPVDDDEFNTGNNKNSMNVVKFNYNVGTRGDGCYRVGHNRSYSYGGAFLTRFGDNCLGMNGNHDDKNSQWYLIRVRELPVTVTEMKYASVYFPVPVTIPAGVKAYTGHQKDNLFILNEITSDIIPAHTGAIVMAEQGTYKFKIVDTNVPSIVGNELQGQLFSDYAKQDIFTLQEGNQGLGLYPFLGKKDYNDGKTNVDKRLVQGFKAFLPQGSLVKGLRFYIQAEQTGILGIDTPSDKPKAFYDLNGKRVYYPTHGVYITDDGKKVFIR